jgi:sortase A
VLKNKNAEDLSVDELRWLLMDKRRTLREERLERFQRTGRALRVAPVAAPALVGLRAEAQPDELDKEAALARRRRFLDGLLLLVEVGAVLGFLFVLYSGLNLMRELNRETIAVLELPTLTPTPPIKEVVLPSGHTPPNAPGGAQPNEAEIPGHLRPLVQSLAALPMPTSSPEGAIRLQIPAIRVDAPIVQGDGWEQLKKGVGQHIGTGIPGQPGNVVLSAHNDVFGEIFRDLDRLKPGDTVTLFTSQRAYIYVVVETKIVPPTEVDWLAQTEDSIATLISCYPYMIDNQRIVVITRLQGSA